MRNVVVPGSKSYTNRALMIGAMTYGPVRLVNPLYADDTNAMIGCLRELGLLIETNRDHIIVHGDIRCIEDKTYHLFAHDSGTTVRFLLALLCIVPGKKVLSGNKRLRERPIRELVEALRELGAIIDYCEEEGKLPLHISSSRLFGKSIHLDGSLSSQFCSALLLIAPYFTEGFTLTVKDLRAKPYVDMTIQCMQDFGVKVDSKESGCYQLFPNQWYRCGSYVIEGDFSSAGYFFALAALTKSTICVENIPRYSLQADRKLLDILEKMGNQITFLSRGICLEGKAIAPVQVDMSDCPDQVMTLAVLAAFAPGVTHISGTSSLRVKETERVVALKTELGKMGICTQDSHDTLFIYGAKPKAALIETYNDHRIAMAFGVASCVLQGLTIAQPEVVTKTFPMFWEELKKLR